MRVIVTGCSGFIGFHLSKKLLDKGNDVLGLDNFSSITQRKLTSQRLKILESYSNFSFFRNSINDIGSLCISGNIDFIINLAAIPGVRLRREQYDMYMESNVQGLKNIFDFCVKKNIKKLIFASSSSVYGRHSKLPFSETENNLEPESFYGLTKKINEDMGRLLSKQNNIKVAALRFFSVYGEYGRPDMAYFLFANQIKNNLTVRLNNMGKMMRDMTYIDDIVNGIELAINHIENDNSDNFFEIINLGNDKPVQVSHMLRLIEKNMSKKAKIVDGKSYNELISTHADLSKAKKILKYQPRVDFEDGMEFFLKWHKNFF